MLSNDEHREDSPQGRFQNLIHELLELLGEDPAREGLLKTPSRVEKSLLSLTSGYGKDPLEVIGDAIFEEHVSDMVLVKDIEFYSMCEHHLLPFFGKVHVAYVADGRVVGLSKLPRLVDVFARRLQLQERLTSQVADSVWSTLKPKGVGVVCEASHLCMMMRGASKQLSSTMSVAVRGVFTEPRWRDELLRTVLRGA